MMMMKRMTLLALVAALVVSLVATTAVAKPGKGKGKGPQKEKTVTYVFQGTVAEVTQAGTNPETDLPITDPDTGEPVEDGVVVDVKQGNKAAKSYIGQQVSFAKDSATKIERNDQEATLAEIQQGDKVMVQVKAAASTTTSSFTAKIISAEGPEPAPDPAQ